MNRIGIGLGACAMSLTLMLAGTAHAADQNVKITVEPSAIPAFVAKSEGLFKGINVRGHPGRIRAGAGLAAVRRNGRGLDFTAEAIEFVSRGRTSGIFPPPAPRTCTTAS
ncbi:hypothetical protein CDEF62S_00487 [Castellaniella defragrans]